MSEKNWEFFARYIGVQGVIAVIMVITICIIHVQGRNVAPEFWGVVGIIIGFYFGKNGRQVVNGLTQAAKKRGR